MEYTNDQIKSFRAVFARRHRMAGLAIVLLALVFWVCKLLLLKDFVPGLPWSPFVSVLVAMAILAVVMTVVVLTVHRCPACNSLVTPSLKSLPPCRRCGLSLGEHREAAV